jgi:hypothetical protein
MLPNLALGIFALISPYLYMLIPVYETYQCYDYYGLNSEQCFIIETNLCVFFSVNWAQTLILVLLLYTIRNVKDELNLKKELTVIIGIWLVFSLLYFLSLQIEISHNGMQNDPVVDFVSIFIFLLI